MVTTTAKNSDIVVTIGVGIVGGAGGMIILIHGGGRYVADGSGEGEKGVVIKLNAKGIFVFLKRNYKLCYIRHDMKSNSSRIKHH